LHVAAQDGRPGSVRRLLAHGADPDLRDPVHQRTPLEWCQPAYRHPDSPAHDEVEAILRPVTGHSQATTPGAARDPSGIQIRIVASGLPGRRDIHVGVQRGNDRGDLLGLHPGDAAAAIWTFPATTVPAPAGLDLTGPYIQGRPGGRFIYLSWGTVDDTGAFTMVKRAKLMLDAVDPATLQTARRYGRLIARLKLTDASGNPLCAAIRPPLIEWVATAAA
jgi:hypothetical protein